VQMSIIKYLVTAENYNKYFLSQTVERLLSFTCVALLNVPISIQQNNIDTASKNEIRYL